jgi:ADP-ribose pyrophosphatase YjhB (NUDIX family)
VIICHLTYAVPAIACSISILASPWVVSRKRRTAACCFVDLAWCPARAWTFPSGFMEIGETTAQGASREALEETCANFAVGSLLAIINVHRVAEVCFDYRAKLLGSHRASTSESSESSETRLIHEEYVSWPELAFPSVWHALKQH